MLPSHEPVLARQPVPQKVSGSESENQRIVRGDIRGTLSKINDRMAARRHHIARS
jgi:hypothetical protein